MTECVQCRGKAQLWLCQPCQSELRDMLIGLARGQLLPSGHYAKGWLDFLHDEAVGDTRKGESARRSSDLTTPMPVNLKASELYDAVGNTLTTCVRDLCETRGAMFHPVQTVGVAFIGPLLADWRRLPTGYVATSGDCARWLAHHVSAIAADESAGVVFAEVKRCVNEIDRVINRPIPPRDLGPCPKMVAHHQACAFRLSAPRKAAEVQCPSCKTIHQVKELVDLLCNELKYWPLSSVEILGSRTSDLPGALDYYGATLARSTFHYWRQHGMLAVRGYRNRDTLAVMPARESGTDDPVFYLADVLLLLGHETEEKSA